jgi:LysM repeat protein
MRPVRFLMVAVLVLAVASFSIAVKAADDPTYVVRPGETLASIAAANGTTAQALADANGLSDPDLIRFGQALIIPRGAVAPSTAVKAAPQSASSPSGPARPSMYVVKPGQTLSQIARELGVGLAAIVDMNGLANPDRIYTGMVLRIPDAQDVTALIGAVTETRFIASMSASTAGCTRPANSSATGVAPPVGKPRRRFPAPTRFSPRSTRLMPHVGISGCRIGWGFTTPAAQRTGSRFAIQSQDRETHVGRVGGHAHHLWLHHARRRQRQDALRCCLSRHAGGHSAVTGFMSPPNGARKTGQTPVAAGQARRDNLFRSKR